MLGAQAEIGDLDMVRGALTRMAAAGISLNRVHWTIAIKAACRCLSLTHPLVSPVVHDRVMSVTWVLSG